MEPLLKESAQAPESPLQDGIELLSMPRWRFSRWLVDSGPDVPPAIREELVRGLYGTIPIFIGGVLNTVAVSTFIAIRHPQPLFIAWAAAELGLAALRLPLLLAGRQAVVQRKRRVLIDVYILLAVLWAATVGYGAFISLVSGDWVSATLACLSAAAMVGGICFRNFGAPRLVAVMILLSLGPCAIGGIFSGEPLMLIALFQIPLYLFSMTSAAFRLNKMLVSTMQSERENDRRARHDELTGLLNRAGFEQEVRQMLRRERGEDLAIFFLDLDGFKSVNDSYGHAAGDYLLKEVTKRLRLVVEPEDVIARLGGDEFVVASLLGQRTPSDVAAAIVSSIGESWYDVEKGVASLGVSIGVALASDHGTDLGGLLAAADIALYEAKSLGRSRFSLGSSVNSAGEGPREPRSGILRLPMQNRAPPRVQKL